MSRPVFSFRPNPENPEHRKAWEILKNVPEGQKNLFLVRAILQKDQTRHLEEMIRKLEIPAPWEAYEVRVICES